MSDEEFLKRWSRRKQEAKVAEQSPPAAEPAAATASNSPEPEIDLSKLPTIDSITAATDITEFLRKGIPAELSRAALRRAWAADPAIRDFVGLAENAWDFTDPDAIPGFGALQGSPEQIGAMVERVLGGARDAAEKLAEQSSGNEEVQGKPVEHSRPRSIETPPGPVVAAMQLPDEGVEPAAAMQPEGPDDHGNVVPVRRRTHGGALPGE
ncbi:MAG: DUF3306 domain-containing protein [Bradyrhizobium sp.]